MRKTLFATLVVIFASLVACSQSLEKQVLGAWRGTGNSLETLVITEKTMTSNKGTSDAITMRQKDNKVFVEHEKNKMIVTLEMLDKDTMLVSVPILGQMKFVRTTEAEIPALWAERDKKWDENQKKIMEKLFGKDFMEKRKK